MRFPLSNADLAVVLAYLFITLLVGLILSKRASRSTEQFFLSGRSLPWWIIGTSMVATTFAADTPLVVSGLIARGGIFRNWLWWQWGFGGIAAVFLFAPLWNRARITTDAELIELRYDGKPASFLRAYRAVWFGVIQNMIVVAWVMKAMTKIIVVVLGLEDGSVFFGLDAEVLIVLFLFSITVIYTVMSGLWGVVITDFLQFVVAMVGSIYLAAAALSRLGGIGGVVSALGKHGFDASETLRMLPGVESPLGVNPFSEFLILILVVWWASYTIDGGGYLAQRLFAAKNERHSVLGYLWYSIAHICLRPWPWILVGLCGMAMFGAVDDPEKYYPMVMVEVLPAGFFGLVIASFFAAFMSTIDTQLNWGASLVVNDLVSRFLLKGKSEGFYLITAKAAVVFLAVGGALVSFLIVDISLAWKLVISITAGLGTVYIARWYWWRVNAWSEISAMLTALACTATFSYLESSPIGRSGIFDFPYSTLWTVMVSVPVWLTVTMMTRPVGKERLHHFYRRVHPGGIGWKRISAELTDAGATGPGSKTLGRIVSGMIMLFSTLLGIGNLVLARRTQGVVMLAAAAVALIFLLRNIGEGMWSKKGDT